MKTDTTKAAGDVAEKLRQGDRSRQAASEGAAHGLIGDSRRCRGRARRRAARAARRPSPGVAAAPARRVPRPPARGAARPRARRPSPPSPPRRAPALRRFSRRQGRDRFTRLASKVFGEKDEIACDEGQENCRDKANPFYSPRV